MDTEGNPMQAVVTELTRDVSGGVIGMAVSLYLPAQLAREIRGKARSWASCSDVGDDGVTYLFLDCDEAELDQVNEALRRNALSWRRSGLSYRTAPDGRQYRWYVRLEDEVSEIVLLQIIENTLGPKSADADSSQGLADWILQFDEENHNLRRLVDQGTLAVEKENRVLQDLISSLQTKIADLEQAAKLSPQQSRRSQRRELGTAISILLPDIHFLRDSLDVITQELESFEPVLLELYSLCSAPVDVKGERVGGAPPWRERHFSTGQKHDGRFYFRNDGDTWHILISFKNSQKRDIDYLKSR